MSPLLFNDITLRDGEQSPGVNFFPEEKLEIARQFVKLNIPIIEAGFAVASESDFRGVNLIASELGGVGGPVICSMARARKGDIDAAYEALRPAARPRIQVVLATSDLHLEHKLKMTRAECVETTREMVAYARTLVDDVEFAAEDATRTDIDFLYTVFEEALKAGARTLEIPDTTGFATPDEYAAIVRGVIATVPGARDAVIATHCHDDLGLATANTLAGIAAGARQAECTINGIGERAGNAPFEEVIVALRTRPGLIPGLFTAETGIDTREIMATSRLVERLSGMAVAPNKAVVGRNAFRHESGIHQHGMLTNSKTYQIIDPETVGAQKIELNLGKLSGKHAFKTKLSELSVEADDLGFEVLYREFKILCSRKKLVLDEDLLALVKHIAK